MLVKVVKPTSFLELKKIVVVVIGIVDIVIAEILY